MRESFGVDTQFIFAWQHIQKAVVTGLIAYPVLRNLRLLLDHRDLGAGDCGSGRIGNGAHNCRGLGERPFAAEK
jgi:hypothetical protein